MASLEIVPGGETNPGPLANGHNCDFMPLVFHCKNLRGGRANEDVRRFGRNDSPNGKAEPSPARLSLQLTDRSEVRRVGTGGGRKVKCGRSAGPSNKTNRN